MNVADYLLKGKDAANLALLPLQDSVTYGELNDAVDRCAARLAMLEVGQGERVVILAENSAFWVAAYLATLRVGAIAVPLPPGISANDLGYIIGETEPKCAFADPKSAKRHAAELIGLRTVQEIPADIAVPASWASTAGDDLAALMFTSGSTGRPRGVMVSHRNIIANTESIISTLSLASSDRTMAVLPFHYCFGTSLLHTHLRVGASLVLDNRFLYPEAVLQRMIETRCTGFAGVPSHYQILLRKSSMRRRQFPDLRYVQQAGGHLAPKFVDELRAALPEVQIHLMYGQTEATARLSALSPEWLECKRGSVGIPVPGVQLTVVDEEGKPCPTGTVGEIVAEGENVTHGYWRDPVETANCFRNGKLYTGDMGSVDKDGFFYVVDRAKDFLKCGGKRISCRELEDAILELEDVLEAAVVGIQDEILGEAVRAFVVPRFPQHDFEGLVRNHCKQRISPVFQPREIVVTNSLPKNSSGKVLKSELRELVSAQV